MENINNIVVVVNRSRDADHVLEKAATIANLIPSKVSVHVVRVIYEEFVEQASMDAERAQALKLYLMQAEEEFLVDLVEDYRNRFADIETSTLWNKRVSDAVLGVTQTFAADLVIKSADPESPHFPRHPDDWSLLRQATCPVFLVKPEPWPPHPVVLAAVNVSDVDHGAMNDRIIVAANTMSKSMGGPLHVVNALPQSSPLLMRAEPGLDFARLECDLQEATREQIGTLLTSKDVEGATLHLEHGSAAHVVAEAADESKASVVVVGTAGRKGVSAMIIGNTSERLLHDLHQDLLVLHV